MSTTVDLFPDIETGRREELSRAASPGRPARGPFRATALRMGMRDVRGEPRAAWLLVALVTLPVLLASAIGLGSTALPRGDERATVVMGSADGMLDLWPFEVEAARERWAQDPATAPDPSVADAATAIALEADDAGPGSIIDAARAELPRLGATGLAAAVGWPWRELTAVDLDDALLDGTHVVRAGRVADSAGEATVSRRQAAHLGVSLGDEILVAGERFEVVGIVDSAQDVRRRWTVVPLEHAELVAGAPTFGFDPAGMVSLFVRLDDAGSAPAFERLNRPLGPVDAEADSPVGHNWSTRAERGINGLDEGRWWSSPAAVGAMVATLSLAVAGLVAAAIWQTRVRRRLRMLGLLAVNGADDTQVRTAVTSEAVVVGLVGGVLGTVGGATLAFALAEPVLTIVGGEATLGVRPTLGTLVLPALLGLAGSVAAAWWPARQVTAVAPQQALAGRAPNRPPDRRTLGRAAALLVIAFAGLGVLAEDGPSPDDATLMVTALLLAATLGCGAVLVLPLVRFLGERLGLGGAVTRHALRDAARQQGRTGAAIAIVAAVLVLPVGIGMAHPANGEPLRDLRLLDVVAGPANAAVDEATSSLVVAWPEPVRAADGGIEPLDAAAAALERRGATSVERTALVDRGSVDLPDDPFDPFGPMTRMMVDNRTVRTLLGDDEVATLDRGGLLLPVWRCDAFPREGDGRRDTDPLPADVGCTAALNEVGYGIAPDARIDATTQGEPAAVVVAAFDGGVVDPLAWLADLPVETTVATADGFRGNAWQMGLLPLLIGQAVAGAVALLVIALTLMLTAAETDRDLDVLFAVGAQPRLRPQVLARQAWLVTTLGALLAVALCIGGAIAGMYDVVGPNLGPVAIGAVSLGSMAVAVLVLPTVVAGVVRLFARRGRATPTIRLT